MTILQRHGCTEAVFTEIGQARFGTWRKPASGGGSHPQMCRLRNCWSGSAAASCLLPWNPHPPKGMPAAASTKARDAVQPKGLAKELAATMAAAGQQSHRHGMSKKLVQIADER